eukprot:Lankesteria_metandrocarpae@DN2251_c0_g1_i1.p1
MATALHGHPTRVDSNGRASVNSSGLLCEVNGRMLSASEAPRIVNKYCHSFPSADECASATVLEELMTATGNPGGTTRAVAPSVCVMKSQIHTGGEFIFLQQLGVIGNRLDSCVTSIWWTFFRSGFVPQSDLVDVWSLLSFCFAVLLYPLSVVKTLLGLLLNSVITRFKRTSDTQRHPDEDLTGGTQLQGSDSHEQFNGAAAKTTSATSTRGDGVRTKAKTHNTPVSNVRYFPAFCSKLNAFAWHPERLLLAEGCLTDGSLALQIPNTRRVSTTQDYRHRNSSGDSFSSSVVLVPDFPSQNSAICLAAEGAADVVYQMNSTTAKQSSDSRRRASVAVLSGAGGSETRMSVPVTSMGGVLRKSLGMLWSKFRDTGCGTEVTLLDAVVNEALDALLSDDERDHRSIGVTAVAFKPRFLDTVIAVGFCDGFEVWRRPSRHNGPVTEQWQTIFWMTSTTRNQFKSSGRFGGSGFLSSSSTANSIASTITEEGVSALVWSPDGTALLVATRSSISVWPFLALTPTAVPSHFIDNGPPNWASPRILKLCGIPQGGGSSKQAKPGLNHKEILDVSWCPNRPIIAVLLSDGQLELIDSTTGHSRVWQLPVERKIPIVSRILWSLKQPHLICANEARLFRLSVGAVSSPNEVGSSDSARGTGMHVPTAILAPRRTHARLHSAELGILRTGVKRTDILAASKGVPSIQMGGGRSDGTSRGRSTSGNRGGAGSHIVNDLFAELLMHPQDKCSRPIASFALDEVLEHRLVVIHKGDPSVYVYQYNADTHDPSMPITLFFIAKFEMALPVDVCTGGTVYPMAVAFSRGASPSLWMPQKNNQSAPEGSTGNGMGTSANSSLVGGHSTSVAVLAVRWGVRADEELVLQEGMCPSPTLKALLRRRLRIGWTQMRNGSNSDPSTAKTSPPQQLEHWNYANGLLRGHEGGAVERHVPLWPYRTVLYPFVLNPVNAADADLQVVLQPQSDDGVQQQLRDRSGNVHRSRGTAGCANMSTAVMDPWNGQHGASDVHSTAWQPGAEDYESGAILRRHRAEQTSNLAVAGNSGNHRSSLLF